MAPWLSAACVVVALLAFAGAAAAEERPPVEQTVVDLVNDTRRSHGVPPLGVVRPLEGSAARRARRMMKTDVFGHLPEIRLGADFPTAGEALALHFGWRARARATVRRWLASPLHRALLLDARLSYAGAGLARGLYGRRLATMWVLHLGGGSDPGALPLDDVGQQLDDGAVAGDLHVSALVGVDPVR
jgi:uncharacterized protein YkwD